MSKILTLVMVLFISSCSVIEKHAEKQDLYDNVEYFIDKLGNTYSSYGIEGIKYTRYTKNNNYKIMPIGRLINVRIEKGANFDEYNELKNDLKNHFKSTTLVKDVYICNAGTIMVDCRY